MHVLDLRKYGRVYNSMRSAVDNLMEHRDTTCTHWVFLDRDHKGNDWAMVFAWQDGYDFSDDKELSKDKMLRREGEDSDWQVVGKVAYQPHRSMMQEYDIDWMMPYDEETGEVDDTEVSMGEDDNSILWLLDQWKRIREELIKEEEEEEEW